MKRWVTGLLLFALIFTFVPLAYAEEPAPATGTATTQADALAPETELAKVSIPPDSIFYSLKLLVENLRSWVARDAAEKAELLTGQATTRLAEAKQMIEAGKADLAAAALKESQQKFQQAQAVVADAVAAGKQLDSLQTQLESSEARFALALDRILVKAPAEARPEFEAAATDVRIQLAATRDSVAPDEELAEAARKLVAAVQDQVKTAAAVDGLPPRVLLVLDAIATESGKPLGEVLDRYRELRGLGDVALELKVKMDVLQTAARLEIKIKGDTMKIELKESDGTRTEIKLEDGKTEVKVENRETETKTGKAKKAFKSSWDEKGCKEHPVFKVHPGRKGEACGEREDKRGDERGDGRGDHDD